VTAQLRLGGAADEIWSDAHRVVTPAPNRAAGAGKEVAPIMSNAAIIIIMIIIITARRQTDGEGVGQ
jgi:hypothetical protein